LFLWREVNNNNIVVVVVVVVVLPGYAFSIWGIIFAFEAAFCVYQMFPKIAETDLVQKGISYWWILMNLFQYGWSFAFALEVSHVCCSLL